MDLFEFNGLDLALEVDRLARRRLFRLRAGRRRDVQPAGWYRDPLGIPQLRWWNGIGWTNHIQEERTELHSWKNEAPVLSLSA